MKVGNLKDAWNMVDEIFQRDYYLDVDSSKRAGYDIYRSNKEHYDYVCDLGGRLEINLKCGRTINIFFEVQEPKVSEREIGEMLSFISNTIYTLDDKFTCNVKEESGMGDVKKQMYNCYDNLRSMIENYYPKSSLINDFNL